MTVGELLADYPDLERDDILAALRFGARAAGRRRVVPLWSWLGTDHRGFIYPLVRDAPHPVTYQLRATDGFASDRQVEVIVTGATLAPAIQTRPRLPLQVDRLGSARFGRRLVAQHPRGDLPGAGQVWGSLGRVRRG